MLARTRRAREDEGGFTLIELLVAAVVGLIVVGSAVTVFTSALRNEPRVSSRAGDVQQARTTMERITRELRQGWGVPVATTSSLSILTYVKSAACGGPASSTSIACRVSYTCSSSACTRSERNPDGSGSAPAQTVVTGLQSGSGFAYAPSAATPTYVGVRLILASTGDDDSITLSDGVTLRNPNPEAAPAG